MKPVVKVVVNGQPVAGVFYKRLKSLTVTHKEGIGADTFSIELDDSNPFLQIPPKGAFVTINIGYGSSNSLGVFVVDKVNIKCLPYALVISGKSADLRSGKLKERQERYWDEKTLKDIINDIAKDAGKTAVIDDELGSFKYDWLGQNDESNVNFLRRLEKRHNGLFHVRDDYLVFAERGSGNSATGSFLGSVVADPSKIIPSTCNFESNDRPRHGSVVAYVQDKNKAIREEHVERGDNGIDSVLRLPEPFASLDEAKAAAKSKAKEIKRDSGGGTVELVGNAAINAGLPFLFSDVRPGLDGVPYIIEIATHTYSKTAGYKTKITAKMFDGFSGGSASISNNSVSETANNNTTVTASNSSEGTTATPERWFGERRYGSTDANLKLAFANDSGCLL